MTYLLEIFELYTHFQPKNILFSGDTLNKPPEIQNTSTLAILQRIWIWIVAVFLTYMVCLSVFPSITAQVESTGTGIWSTTYFIPVGCFLLFNIGDFAGRMLASFIQWPKANHMGSLIGMVSNKMSIVTILGLKLLSILSKISSINLIFFDISSYLDYLELNC